jgi:hypothetical protein
VDGAWNSKFALLAEPACSAFYSLAHLKDGFGGEAVYLVTKPVPQSFRMK